MKLSHRCNSSSALRAGSAVVLASMLVPLAGCGSNAPTTNMAPPPANVRPSGGLTTKNKLVLLAGAAALYYYYQKSKKANASKNVQYYLSKNGRIYYRDPRNPKNVVWVTPPPQQVQSVQLPPDQAQAYSGIQGYDNQTTGNNLAYYFNGPGGAARQ